MTDTKPPLMADGGVPASSPVNDPSQMLPGTYQDMLRIGAIAAALKLPPDTGLETFEASADPEGNLSALAQVSELIAAFLCLDPRDRCEIVADVLARAQARGSDV